MNYTSSNLFLRRVFINKKPFKCTSIIHTHQNYGHLPKIRSIATKLDTTSTIKEKFDPFQNDTRPIILYDGICNFCNSGINLVLDLDTKKQFRFAALQSETGKKLLERCGRNESDISSMVLVTKDNHYIKSDAALKIGEKLNMSINMLMMPFWPLPKSFRDKAYDFIADNRYKILGVKKECRVTDLYHADRFLS